MKKEIGINGSLSEKPNGGVYQLKYAKNEANLIIQSMYPPNVELKLERKYKKVYAALGVSRMC